MNPKTLSASAFLSCVLWFLCSFDKFRSTKEQNENTEYDVIIVPGVPYNHPSYKMVLKARMLWAKYLYDNKITKNIIFSGAAVYTPYVEAKVMRIYADSMGIPQEHVFCETQAEHSIENIYYSVELAKKMGFSKIAVATDHYQIVVVKGYIKHNYPFVSVIPIQYSKLHLLSNELPSIEAESAHTEMFVSLKEKQNRITRLKGTLGMNIRYNEPEYYTMNKSMNSINELKHLLKLIPLRETNVNKKNYKKLIVKN